MLRAVSVEEKRRMQIPVKANWDYYCSSCKTVKVFIYDEMV